MSKKRNTGVPGTGQSDIVELENSTTPVDNASSSPGPIAPVFPDTSKVNLLSQIGKSRNPNSGNDVMNLINVDDFKFQGSPGAQDSSTYYPSQTLSPARIDQQAGRYFASLPLKQGGQVLYPMGLADARRKALEEAAYKNEILNQKKQGESKSFFDQYKMLQGLPAYQDKLDNYFQTEIIDGIFNKAFDKYGKYAVNKLSDPSTPEYQDLVMKYHQYETLTNATKTLDASVTDALKRKKDGETLSQEQEGLISDYYKGNLIYNDKGQVDFSKLLTSPGALKLYDTGWSRMKDLQPFINKDAETIYEKGIDVVGPDGKTKHLTGENGVEFINAVKKNGPPEEKLDQYAQYMADDPNLNQPGLQGAARKDYWKQFVKNNWGNTIEKQLYQIKASGGKGKGAGAHSATDLTWIVDSGYNTLMKTEGKEHVSANGNKYWSNTPAYNFQVNTGNINGEPQYKTIDEIVIMDNGDKFYTLKEEKDPKTGRAPINHPFTNYWNEIIVPTVNKAYGTGASEKLEKLKDYAVTQGNDIADVVGVPYLKKNVGAGGAGPKEGDEQAVQGGTAIYKNGKWVMKQ